MIGSLAALLAVIVLAAGGLPVYAAQRYQAEPLREAVELIRSTSTPDRTGVLFDRADTYERLAPYLPGWPALAALRVGGAADAWSDARVDAFARERAETWYILDYGATQQRATGDAIDRRLSESLCVVGRQFAGAARLTHYTSVEPAIILNISAKFEDNISLDSVSISDTAIRAGEPICVELTWTAGRTPSTDYTAFVHLLDANGQIVAQSDLSPGNGFAPTTAWQPAQAIVDRRGLIAPTSTAPGSYRVIAGLYDAEGTRLPVRSRTTAPADAVVLSEVEIGR
jgi:hypothetical protein